MPYEVIKRIPEVDVEGVNLGGKFKHKFREGVSFRLPDSERGQANEIAQTMGQERKDGKEATVLVAEVPDRSKKMRFISNWGSGSAWKQDRPWLKEDEK